MIDDIIWKLFRKLLSDSFYEKLRKSKLGRPYKYLSLSTYQHIYNHYVEQKIEFRGKTVLEIGSGLQFFTAFFLLYNGSKNVILVDPVFSNSDYLDTMNKQFLEFKKFINVNDDILHRIEVFPSFNNLPQPYQNSIDCITSHFVMEHIDNLNQLFKQAYSLLVTNGIFYSFVDLSDHTYHIFDSRKITQWIYKRRMLYHFRYSDAFYKKISDPRTWVNRQLFPVYRSIASDTGFQISSINLIKCHIPKVHKDIRDKLPIYTNEELNVSHFSLLLKKCAN